MKIDSFIPSIMPSISAFTNPIFESPLKLFSGGTDPINNGIQQSLFSNSDNKTSFFDSILNKISSFSSIGGSLLSGLVGKFPGGIGGLLGKASPILTAISLATEAFKLFKNIFSGNEIASTPFNNISPNNFPLSDKPLNGIIPEVLPNKLINENNAFKIDRNGYDKTPINLYFQIN
jgi:hypothetical protein